MSFSYQKSDVVGLRVVRGPDWKWTTQDGGEGFVGTITSLKTNERLDALLDRLPGMRRHLKAVIVVWDCGTAGNYRVGIGGAFDLRLLDNSTTVSQHHDVSCAECCRGSIEGLRWDCALCDVPLCSSCYFNDVHEKRNEETHCGRLEYQRYMTFDCDPVTVWKDLTVSRVELKGIFNEARVKRGRDWDSGDEDTSGSVSGVGQIVTSTSNIGPGWVHVKWPGSNNTFPYRLGADGKVDLRLEKHTSGGRYQPEHLPVLKLDEMDSAGDCGMSFAMGDLVRVNVDAETLKFMQDGHGGWVDDMERVAGKTGVVLSVNPVGVILKFQELNRKYCINTDALVRLGPFSVGQPVRVKSSAEASSQATIKIADRTGSVLRCLLYGNDDVEIVLDDDAKHGERRVAVHRVPARMLEALPVNESIQNKVSKSTKKLTRLFVLAASEGQLPFLKRLWSTRFLDVNGKDKAGQTALQLASRRGHVETVEWLIEKGASAGLGDDKKDRNAIHHAAKGGQAAVLVTLARGNRELLEMRDKKGWTPLLLAMRAGCVKSIRVLIDNGCNIYDRDKDGDSALFNAIIMETKSRVYRDHAIVDTLLERTENLDYTNDSGQNMVMIAALNGNKRVLKNLLLKSDRLGMSLFRQSNKKRLTALHALCHEGDYLGLRVFMTYAPEDAVRELIEWRCIHDFTPLLLAAYKCRYSAVEFLISSKENKRDIRSDVKAVDEDGDTAAQLVAAVMDRHSEKPSERESPEIHKIYRDLSLRYPELIEKNPALSLLCYLVRHSCPWRRTSNRTALAVFNDNEFRSILMEFCPHGGSGDIANRITVCSVCEKSNVEAGTIEGCSDTLNVCNLCVLQFPRCLACGRPNKAYHRNQTDSANKFPETADGAKNVSSNLGTKPFNEEITSPPVGRAGAKQRANATQNEHPAIENEPHASTSNLRNANSSYPSYGNGPDKRDEINLENFNNVLQQY